jgi:hypothetical protein
LKLFTEKRYSMKLTTALLKQFIQEAKKEKDQIFKSDLSSYELEDLDTDKQTIALLGEILNQIKTLVYYSTPARSPVGASVEQGLASTIQEGGKVAKDVTDAIDALGVEDMSPEAQEKATKAAAAAIAAAAAEEESDSPLGETLNLIKKLIEEEITNILNEKEI